MKGKMAVGGMKAVKIFIISNGCVQRGTPFYMMTVTFYAARGRPKLP